MSRSRPFFGETDDPEKAFPGISFSLQIKQDKYGHYRRSDHHGQSRFTKSNTPRYLKCINPKCQQGGMDLQSFVNFNQSGEYHYHCNGHEGSPKGRRKGDPCDNDFEVVLEKTEDPQSNA